MSLLTINNDLLWWFSVCYAEGLDDSSVYWTFWICLPVQGDRNTYLQGERAIFFPELWRWRVCQLWHTWFLRQLRTLGPEASNPPCGEARFPARTLHQVLNRNFYHTVVAENRHGPAQAVWPRVGCAPVPSHLVCTILYSLSPCVSPTPPLSSIAMEKPCWCMYLTSVQMHLFEKENETLTYL